MKTIHIEIEKETFVSRGKTVKIIGWMECYLENELLHFGSHTALTQVIQILLGDGLILWLDQSDYLLFLI
ncbi:MAG: hypothetical protein ACYDG2_11570 [Ruminiclostridium sp.]